MTDVYELLRKKENDIVRVRKEIDALHLVGPMLSDSDEGYDEPANGHPDVAAVENEENVVTYGLHQDQPSDESEPAEASSEPIRPKRGILGDWFNRAAGE